jgi:hypothetical protein
MVRDADADARHGAREAWTPDFHGEPFKATRAKRAQDHHRSLSQTSHHDDCTVPLTLSVFHRLYERLSLTTLYPTVLLLPLSAMAVGNLEPELRPTDLSGGTGARFARAIVIVAGSCALVASLLTFVFVLRPSLNVCPLT